MSLDNDHVTWNQVYIMLATFIALAVGDKIWDRLGSKRRETDEPPA